MKRFFTHLPSRPSFPHHQENMGFSRSLYFPGVRGFGMGFLVREGCGAGGRSRPTSVGGRLSGASDS
jgi:hypothetical protein